MAPNEAWLTGIRNRQMILPSPVLLTVWWMILPGLLVPIVVRSLSLWSKRSPGWESRITCYTERGQPETEIPQRTEFQLVIPAKSRKEIMEFAHDKAGHMGRERTIALLRPLCYWPGMYRDVKDHVQDCPRCMRRKHPVDQVAPLQNVFTTHPMDLVCIDYLTLESSKGGFENILVVTDHFTKYSQAYPTRNQTARTTA